MNQPNPQAPRPEDCTPQELEVLDEMLACVMRDFTRDVRDALVFQTRLRNRGLSKEEVLRRNLGKRHPDWGWIDA